ncbi:MAG TPA: glycosyltransferase family 39 protein [Thermomicrobiales bacterium]|nr:glycosyltransferase family 39 protein [Thermomicrobiales bacterium]
MGVVAEKAEALRLRGRFDWSPLGPLLAMKAVLFLFGLSAYQVLSNQRVASFHDFLELWNRWDAPHYLDLAQHGYQSTGDERFFIVFFPLFPWLTRLVAFLAGDYLVAAFVVATLASLAAGFLLHALAKLDYGKEFADRAVWFLFIFPTSYFLHIGYTEGLFLALALGAFLAARREHWWLAGVLGACVCLTRLNGLVLVPALAVEAVQQYRRGRRWRWHWFGIGLIGLGVVVYLGLNLRTLGDPLAFLGIQQEHWYRTFAWPWQGIHETIDSISWRAPTDAHMIGVEELLFTMLGLAATIVVGLTQRPSYAIWMAGNWLVFTTQLFIYSVPRLSLILFPLYFLFARLAENRTWYAVLTMWSLLFLALFAGQFVLGKWAF